jgi:hypothetical protein
LTPRTMTLGIVNFGTMTSEITPYGSMTYGI